MVSHVYNFNTTTSAKDLLFSTPSLTLTQLCESFFLLCYGNHQKKAC